MKVGIFAEILVRKCQSTRWYTSV